MRARSGRARRTLDLETATYPITVQTKQAPESGTIRHRLLAAVGPGQSAEQVLRWTCALAASLNWTWIAVYVETSAELTETERSLLGQNLALARDLGAEVVTTTDDELAPGLLRVALQRNVSGIAIGVPSNQSAKRGFRKSENLLRQLIRRRGEMEIHLVPVGHEAAAAPRKVRPRLETLPARSYLAAVGIMVLLAAAAFPLSSLIGFRAIGFIFLLGVVEVGLFFGRGPCLVAAVLSALLWDYFFEPPLYSFRIGSFDDQKLFWTYSLAALMLGQLVARIRAQEKAERQREELAVAQYLMTRELTEAANVDQLLHSVVPQTERAFRAPTAVWLTDAAGRLEPRPHPASTYQMSDEDRHAVGLIFEQVQPAGLSSDSIPLGGAHYVFLTIGGRRSGVIGVKQSHALPLTIHQRNLLNAFSQQIALALDRLRLREESARNKFLAESERLSKTLLNSVSHEIRTPLAAIKAAVDNVNADHESVMTPRQREMMLEIDSAIERLDRLVGKVLDVNRLESGHLKAKFHLQDVGELVADVLQDVAKELSGHQVTVEIAPELPLVPMDYNLMEQSLKNLLSNAAFHTPPGTPVRIGAEVENGDLVLAVADHGPGLPPASIQKLFGKFYRAPDARPGGTGLGLSVVKGFVEAQGGRVTADNHAGGGAVFTIRLPLNQSSADSVLENN